MTKVPTGMNEVIPPEYKQTEVGVIPEEWNVHTLRSCLSAQPDYGINAPAVPYSDKLPTYIRITDITEDGRFSSDKPVSVKRADADRYYLNDGDIVFARTGASVGKSYLYKPHDGRLVFAGFLIRVSPETAKLVPAYLAGYVTTEAYWNWVRLMSMRSGQPGINGQEYGQLPIPLPPTIDEQRAIAGTLSDVDALIGALDQLIAKKRDLKQAAMQQLLTGKTRLPGFDGTNLEHRHTEVGEIPEDWTLVEVKEVTRSHKQGYYTKEKYVERGVKLVRITDLMNPRINYPAMPMLNISESDYDLYKVKVGDFLFARSGAIGRCGIVSEEVDAVFGSYIIRFSFDPNQLSNEYFGFLYETPIVWKQLLSITQGSSNININAANIKSIKIPLPSIAEQTAIATVLSDMDAEIAALEQRRDKTRALKQGMMQELLTGRTRLPLDEGTPFVA